MRIAMNTITQCVDEIANRFHPHRIVLFGSYAYGRPSEQSDVDLLVILPFEGKGARKAAEIINAISARFPLDVIAKTPEEYHQRLEWGDNFLKEIERKGVVLYEASDA